MPLYTWNRCKNHNKMLATEVGEKVKNKHKKDRFTGKIMTMNSPNECDYFSTLHLQSIYSSLHMADTLMPFFFIQLPRVQGVLWHPYGVTSEMLPSVQENAEIHFRLENNILHSMDTPRLGPPGYLVFLVLFFPLVPRGSYFRYFLCSSSHMLGDNFASYFTEVTDDSLSISPLFFFLLPPLVNWTMMITHFKVEILIASHQSLPTPFTISLISEEQEHLTLYTCALCSNLISVLSSSWESALLSSLHQEMKIFRIRDFSFNFCHKVFEILATFFTVSCPQTFWNIFWFIFQRETWLV